MRGTGTCEFCLQDVGSNRHEFHECAAQAADVACQRWAGRLKRIREDLPPALAPLVEMALPPKLHGWEPTEIEYVEGHLSQGYQQESYGDGSGYRQHQQQLNIATWSVIRMNKNTNDEWQMHEGLRGNMTGWFRTVPRAEMKAFAEHLRHAGPGAVYVGDCKVVIDAAAYGVQRNWTSWRNVNSDLWRAISFLQNDHDTEQYAVKVKSHRGREAIADDEDERRWKGNQLADSWAKSLGKAMLEGESAKDRLHEQTVATYTEVLKHIAFSAAWVLRRRPPESTIKPPKPRKPDLSTSTKGHDIAARTSGGWECTSCRKLALSRTGLRALKSTECEGEPGGSGAIHHTHRMQITRGVHWCAACGAYTVRWPRELKRACKGAPGSEAQANVRRRLSSGLAPTTAHYLEDADKLKDRAKQGRADHRRHSQPPPCGRYLRLPGGPLHRGGPRDVHEDEVDGGDAHDHADEERGGADGEDAHDAVDAPERLHGRADEGDVHNLGGPGSLLIGADYSFLQTNQESRFSKTNQSPEDALDMERTHDLGTNLNEELADTKRMTEEMTLEKPMCRARVAEVPEQGTSRIEEQMTTLQEATVLPRRRIRVKTSPTLISSQPACSQHRWPLQNTWSSRVQCSAEPDPSECNSCRVRTRLTCRTCSRSLCFKCARDRVRCSLIRAGMS